ncbi:hypothetical protein [Lactiplantibacillus plantarum]
MSYRAKFTTYLDDALVQRIKIQAIREKRSVADILNEVVHNYLQVNEPTGK